MDVALTQLARFHLLDFNITYIQTRIYTIHMRYRSDYTESNGFFRISLEIIAFQSSLFLGRELRLQCSYSARAIKLRINVSVW